MTGETMDNQPNLENVAGPIREGIKADPQAITPPQPGVAAPSGSEPASPELDFEQALGKFEGKSRNEILQSYLELEKKFGEQGQENGAMRSLVQHFGPFINYDPESGQVDLNDLMIRQHLASKGYNVIQPGQQARPAQDHQLDPMGDNQNAQVNPLQEKFSEDPIGAMRELIRQEMGSFKKENLVPLQQQFLTESVKGWSEALSRKYPDFAEYSVRIADHMKRKNIVPRSINDLAEAYMTVKALNGGFVDKTMHEAHLEQLKATQAVPAFPGSRPAPGPDASMEELFGLDQTSDNSDEAKATRLLFNKGILKP